MQQKNERKHYIIKKIIYCLFSLFIIFIEILNKGPFSDHFEEKSERIIQTIEQAIDDYYSFLPDEYKIEELKLIQNYKLLTYNISKIDLKIKLFSSLNQQKDINKVDCLVLRNDLRFGNSIIALNNAIFYCEILECRRIILFEGFGLIKNKIKYHKYIHHKNIAMEISEGNNIYSNYRRNFCIYFNISFFYFPKYAFPQIRTDSIKEEILKNLPYVEINQDDIYICIRSGDIFSNSIPSRYSQPPFCFYEKIIKNFKFRNYYIISENKKNPVIDELLNKFSFVKYISNSLKNDISIICHAYNLVGGVSSFVISSIKFNDNLKNFWQYNIYRIIEKFLHLHQDIYNFKIKYNIYTMEPSLIYKKEMFTWRNTSFQINLIFNDSCPYNFTLRKGKN